MVLAAAPMPVVRVGLLAASNDILPHLATAPHLLGGRGFLGMTTEQIQRSELAIILMRMYALRTDISPELRGAAIRGADKLEQSIKLAEGRSFQCEQLGLFS
jgi:hypothetical protein